MNRYAIVILAGTSLIAACSASQTANVDKAIVAGQLYCAKATTVGPQVVALADASGVPVTVTNKASDVVAKACAVIGGFPVSPPANPANTPSVSAQIP